jgi:hypothetical protein
MLKREKPKPSAKGSPKVSAILTPSPPDISGMRGISPKNVLFP